MQLLDLSWGWPPAVTITNATPELDLSLVELTLHQLELKTFYRSLFAQDLHITDMPL